MNKHIGLLALGLLALTGCSPYSLTFSEVYNGAELSRDHTFRIVTPDEGSLPPGMSMVTYYNIAAALREQMVERGFTEDPSSPVLLNIGLTVRDGVVNTPVTTTVQTSPLLPPPGPYPGPFPGPRPAPQDPVNVPDYNPLQGAGPGLQLPPQRQQPPQPPRPPRPQPQLPPHNGLRPYFMYPRAYYWPNYTTVTQWVPEMYREGVLTIDLVNTLQHTPLYSASVATILDNGNSQLRSLSGIAAAVKVLFSKFPIPVLPQYR